MATAVYTEDRRITRLHWPLVLTVMGIAALGVYNLGSVGINDGLPSWIKQIVWLGGGTLVVAATLLVDYRVLRDLAWPVFIVTLVMLVAVPLVGVSVKGAKRWLRIAGMTVQPSEFAKIAVILMLARHFGDNPAVARNERRAGLGARIAGGFRQFMANARSRRSGALARMPARRAHMRQVRETGYRLNDLWIPFALLFIPALIVIKQPDLGTGLCITALGGSIILFAGLTPGTLGLLFTTGIGGAVLAWFFALKPYQKARVLTYLDPEIDPQGTAYHAIQSFIAVGAGQVWGKGWGNGTQAQFQFLPEQHTDFAFSAWAEEHGFVGSVMVVALYLLLVFWAIDIASNARDRFGAYLAFGAGALFAWHAFINIGMVIGLLPVVGVPLLLFSYGGSAAVLSLSCIGILLNVHWRRKDFG